MNVDRPSAPGRRRFIGSVGALLAAPSLLQSEARAVVPDPYLPSAIGALEFETLIAVMGRLIPADASGGGAVEAHAHVYIDRALASAYALDLPTYRSGLAAIDLLAKKEGASVARRLAPTQLDAILTRMEQGLIVEPLAGEPSHPTVQLVDGGRTFFQLLLRHTLEGTFGDPIHGGNHDYLGWRLIGYPGIQLFYSASEQSVNGPTGGKNRSVAEFGRKAE